MHDEITQNIAFMSYSQQEMARILEAKKHVVQHIAKVIHDIPGEHPGFGPIDAFIGNSMLVSKSIAAYLSSLADLEDALTANLTTVMKELKEQRGDE